LRASLPEERLGSDDATFGLDAAAWDRIFDRPARDPAGPSGQLKPQRTRAQVMRGTLPWSTYPLTAGYLPAPWRLVRRHLRHSRVELGRRG
jgi:hypothetical protein